MSMILNNLGIVNSILAIMKNQLAFMKQAIDIALGISGGQVSLGSIS